MNGLKADVVEQLLTGSEDENEAVDSQNPDDVKNQLAAAIEEANEQARSIKMKLMRCWHRHIWKLEK